MKKTLLLLLTLVVGIMAMANPVTPDEARQNIARFMSPRRAGGLSHDPSALKLVATSNYNVDASTMAPSYYVFNMSQGQGYVVAAADDRIPAILGYSLSGEFDAQNMPDNMRAWLKSYNDQMEYLSRHPEAAVPRRTVKGDAISPLVQSHWDQNAPYNDLCPMDDEVHSLTGCVATAMAQIMNYWKYPGANTTAIPEYVTADKSIKVAGFAAGTVIDWENMQSGYNGSETDAQKQAVANLMLMCGTAIQMDYTAKLSLAYDNNVAIALRSFFDYDLGTIHEDRSMYRAAEWNQKIYDELAARRPVYYDGASSGGGHAFVVDGYSGDDYFHINWGWGGQSDDYFLLSIVNPNNTSGAGSSSTQDGYSFQQGAIFGIQPPTGKDPVFDELISTNAWAIMDSTIFVRSGINEDFVFKVGFSYYNSTTTNVVIDYGLGYYLPDGQLLSVVKAPKYGNLKPGYGFYDPQAEALTTKLGKGAEAAAFVIYPVYSKHGTGEWRKARGSDYINIHGIFKGDSLIVFGPIFGLTGKMAATGTKEEGSHLPVTASITNQGTFYKGEVFLTVDGQMVGGQHIDIEGGAVQQMNFSYIPTKSGKQEVAFCTRYWDATSRQFVYNPFIKDSIDVLTAPPYDIAMQCKITNAKGSTIKESRVLIKVKATNNSNIDYNNALMFNIFKDRHSGDNMFYLYKSATKQVQIGSKQTIETDFEFSNLPDDNYILVGYNVSEGKWKQTYKSPILKIDAQPDGIQLAGCDVDNDNAVVYGLDGNKVAEGKVADIRQRLKTLPKGVYIVHTGQYSTMVRN